MYTESNSLTRHPDVNEILNVLLIRVQEILDDQFIGMYLHGSLANGGFDEHSDIDVIVVTAADISEQTFSALKEMHEQITRIDSPWALQLEVSYIPQSALRRFDRQNKFHPHMDRGEGETLHRMAHESDWIIQRHILRERGIVVMGPDPKTLIDPVSPDELRQAIVDVLPLWLDPILNDPSRINKRGYQSLFVLSLCRVLYTLRHGEIIPKHAAAKWGKENLDGRWLPLIERALIGRQNPGLDVEPEDIQGTLDMMRYTLDVIPSDPPGGERHLPSHSLRSGTMRVQVPGRILQMTGETLRRSAAQSDTRINQPTPYPDVNEVLDLLLSSTKEILRDQFVGTYLYGSLSSGDFNPESSDIDFLFVTDDLLEEAKIAALEAMHNRIWAAGLKWASKLEGAYVPKELIRRHEPNCTACPTVNEGRFYVAGLGSDWIIQRHIVREHGVVLAGPDPKALIDPVSPDEIREAVLGVLREWWFPMLRDPSWLRERGSEYHAFAVISMCRALHGLEHGTIVSKPKAIQWAREKLGDPWSALIDQAVAAARHENRSGFLAETLNFIRFTKEATPRFEQSAPER